MLLMIVQLGNCLIMNELIIHRQTKFGLIFAEESEQAVAKLTDSLDY